MDLIDQLTELGQDLSRATVRSIGHDENGVSGVIYTTFTEEGERIDEFVPWEDMVWPESYSTPDSISSMTYFQFIVLYGCARDKAGEAATPETVMNYFAQHWYTLVKERDDFWNSIPHGLLPGPVRKSEYTPPAISSMTYEESYALYQDFQTYADDEANATFRESNLSERVARRLLGQLDSIADLKSYLAEIGPKMSDIDSLTDEEVASFNETLRLFKEVITDTGLDSAALDPRTDTGMNLETLDPRTDTNLMAILDSYIAALDEKEAKTADTTNSDPADNVTLQNIEPGLYGPGNVTVQFNPDYQEQMPAKLIGLAVFPDLPLEEIPADIAEYYAKFFPNQSLTDTYSDEEIAQLQGVLDSYIASRKEQEAKAAGTTVADPDGPTYPVNWIVSTDNTPQAYKLVLVDDEPLRLIPVNVVANRDYGEGWSVIGRGDFNGNGTKDVLVMNPTAASDTVGLIGYWENDSEWNLLGGYSPEWDVVATADFNGDGKTDILWRNCFAGEDGNTYNAYCTWIMDEADGWRMVSASNADEWDFLCTGDFDGDGTADIAMINASGLVSVWGVSDGRLGADAVLSAVDSEWKFAAVGDFNGDGTDDIMWAHTDGAVFAADRYGYWQIDNGQLASWESGSAGLVFLSEELQSVFATLA